MLFISFAIQPTREYLQTLVEVRYPVDTTIILIIVTLNFSKAWLSYRAWICITYLVSENKTGKIRITFTTLCPHGGVWLIFSGFSE